MIIISNISLVFSLTSFSSVYSAGQKAISRRLFSKPNIIDEKRFGDDDESSTDVTDSTTLSKDTQLSNKDLMEALGTSPRRIFLSLSSATGIALAGNLFGVTSKLLTLLPEDVVEESGLDTYFPRGDFKRCVGEGYSFVIPKEWVADTFVALAKAQQGVKSLDFEMKRSRSVAPLPDAAYGPPGRLNKRGVSEQGDTNVSVIVSNDLAGFSLREILGSPEKAAVTLLQVSLAPEGSGRTATLLKAEEDSSRHVYQFEYNIDRGEKAPSLRAISVIAERNFNTLITLTVVAPLDEWEDVRKSEKLRKIAESFH